MLRIEDKPGHRDAVRDLFSAAVNAVALDTDLEEPVYLLQGALKPARAALVAVEDRQRVASALEVADLMILAGAATNQNALGVTPKPLDRHVSIVKGRVLSAARTGRRVTRQMGQPTNPFSRRASERMIVARW
jgi:hypothetical protein